jgi:hypothetical protein
MTLFLGDRKIKEMYLGDRKIKEAYLGDRLVYGSKSFNPRLEYVTSLTINNMNNAYNFHTAISKNGRYILNFIGSNKYGILFDTQNWIAQNYTFSYGYGLSCATYNIVDCDTIIADNGAGNIQVCSVNNDGSVDSFTTYGAAASFSGAIRPVMGFSWGNPKNFRYLDVNTRTMVTSATVSGSNVGIYFDDGTNIIANINNGNMLSVSFDGNSPVDLGSNPDNLYRYYPLVQKDDLSICRYVDGPKAIIFDRKTLRKIFERSLEGDAIVAPLYRNSEYVAIMNEGYTAWPRPFTNMSLFSFDMQDIPVDVSAATSRGFDQAIAIKILNLGKYIALQRNDASENNMDIFELKLN